MDGETKTSLDAIETSRQISMPRSYRQHSTSLCDAEFQATREAYQSMPGRNSETRMNAFDSCRTKAWFVRHQETGDVRVAAKSCKLRWCPICAKKKQWFLAQQFMPWAESTKKLKFLTLTLKHTEAPLSIQISNLYTFFQKFRKLKFLKDNIQGGVWFFQITKSKKDGLWHPHLHCIIDANYMQQEKLSRLWQRTTLGSMIVDIQAVRDPAKVAEYIGRYSARPSSLAGMELSERLELMQAMHGRRLVGTWGNAKETALTMQKPDDAGMWKYVGSWSTVHGVLDCDENAKAIYKAWMLSEPLAVDIDMYHVENALYDIRPYVPKEPPENMQLFLFDVHDDAIGK